MGVDTQRATIKWRYLGFSPLIFTFLSFIELPPAEILSFDDPLSPLYFFLFYLAAAAITLLSFALFMQFNPAKQVRIPPIVCILPSIAGIGLCFAYGVTSFGVPFQFSCGAALIGVGSSLLLIEWGHACGFLNKQAAIPTLAAVFALAYMLKILSAPFITGTFNLLIVGSAIILSAIPLDSLTRSMKLDETISLRTNYPSVSFAIKKLWKPLLGVSLLCLIWGSTWGSSLVGARGLHSENVIDVLEITALLTCLVTGILALWKQAKTLRSFILPAAVGLLILAWFFRFFENPAIDILGDIFTGAATAGLPLILWIWICSMSDRQPKQTQYLVTIAHAFLSLVILLSFAATLLVGAKTAELATPMLSILLFILYANPFPLRNDNVPSSPSDALGDNTLSSDIPLANLETHFGLTPRESEICFYFSRGHSAKYISEQLCVSQNTVKTHVKRIYVKLGVSSKDELITLLSTLPETNSNRDS